MDIEKEIMINTSVSRVYGAITDMKQLSQWFPDVISLEPKIDGKITFRSSGFSSNVSDIIEGKIIELEKNKKLAYTWSHPNVPNFPLTKVIWNLEQITKNKTKVVIVHSGFVDENTMNLYNKKWLGIAEHLDVFTGSKKSASTRKQIISTTILLSVSLMSLVLINTFQINGEFVSGNFWLSLLVISLTLIPIINKYKKFSWKEKPMITSIGITILAQIMVTAYWGFFISDVSVPLVERLVIDMTLFYSLMISLIPVGFGISYVAIKFTNKSQIVQGTELVTIQFSENKVNKLLVSLITFQVFLNIVVYGVSTGFYLKP